MALNFDIFFILTGQHAKNFGESLQTFLSIDGKPGSNTVLDALRIQDELLAENLKKKTSRLRREQIHWVR